MSDNVIVMKQRERHAPGAEPVLGCEGLEKRLYVQVECSAP